MKWKSDPELKVFQCVVCRGDTICTTEEPAGWKEIWSKGTGIRVISPGQQVNGSVVIVESYMRMIMKTTCKKKEKKEVTTWKCIRCTKINTDNETENCSFCGKLQHSTDLRVYK